MSRSLRSRLMPVLPYSQWLPLHVTDSDEIYYLIRAMEIYDHTLIRTTIDEVEGFFADDFHWRARGIRNRYGELIAFGLVRAAKDQKKNIEVISSGGILPGYREKYFGVSLIQMNYQQARQLLDDMDIDEAQRHTARTLVHIESDKTHAISLLRHAGYHLEGGYVQMRRHVGEPLEEIALSPFIRMYPFSEKMEKEIFHSHQEIFTQSHQSSLNFEQWKSEKSNLEPSWSFGAFDMSADRPMLAGYIMCQSFPQDWQVKGYREGYIDEIAVKSPWRGMHLMTALLQHAMKAMNEDGMEYAGIDVPIHVHEKLKNYSYRHHVRKENMHKHHEESVDLFEKFGFEQTVSTHIYARCLS